MLLLNVGPRYFSHATGKPGSAAPRRANGIVPAESKPGAEALERAARPYLHGAQPAAAFGSEPTTEEEASAA